ncbi:MAG TPA: Smr/MutS family protein [Xanthobacteraceae bacterium]|nr:Smr/MutS family protein [Xanthobacteraceae bacterium]
MTRGSKRPAPAGDDHALWGEVTRSIKPLKGRKAAPVHVGSDPPVRKAARPAATVAPGPASPRAAPPPLAPMERRMRQRLSRGSAGVDARLDLHGLRQAAAKPRLENFLKNAQARGHTLVLVITGKGEGGDSERGVLRRQVPYWLALPELRSFVVGFEEAGRGHGGAGALYVRVRRER